MGRQTLQWPLKTAKGSHKRLHNTVEQTSLEGGFMDVDDYKDSSGTSVDKSGVKSFNNILQEQKLTWNETANDKDKLYIGNKDNLNVPYNKTSPNTNYTQINMYQLHQQAKLEEENAFVKAANMLGLKHIYIRVSDILAGNDKDAFKRQMMYMLFPELSNIDLLGVLIFYMNGVKKDYASIVMYDVDNIYTPEPCTQKRLTIIQKGEPMANYAYAYVEPEAKKNPVKPEEKGYGCKNQQELLETLNGLDIFSMLYIYAYENDEQGQAPNPYHSVAYKTMVEFSKNLEGTNGIQSYKTKGMVQTFVDSVIPDPKGEPKKTPPNVSQNCKDILNNVLNGKKEISWKQYYDIYTDKEVGISKEEVDACLTANGIAIPTAPLPPPPPSNIFFENQTNLASCGRHAINNIVQGVLYDITTDTGRPISFENPPVPINMKILCEDLTARFDSGDENLFMCQPGENYNVNTMVSAMLLAGYDYSKNDENNVREYHRHSTTKKFINIEKEYYIQDDDNVVFLIKRSPSPESGHWISARKINNILCSFDSMSTDPNPLTFYNKNVFLDTMIRDAAVQTILLFTQVGNRVVNNIRFLGEPQNPFKYYESFGRRRVGGSSRKRHCTQRKRNRKHTRKHTLKN
jgi:hypothetical protein